MVRLFCLFLTIAAGFSRADKIGPPGFGPPGSTEKPFGPYYCQARCLASCLESYLAATAEQCQQFCPPFEQDMPCPSDDAQCWLTCGAPASSGENPSPESPILTPMIQQVDENLEPDPFTIELAWNPVPNASLYIVEFFPHNRQPKLGESNFFQVATETLTYKVRKDDECIEYSGRVMAVNSYGISVPTYTFVGAPVPSMRPTGHFAVRNMHRDPWSPDMVTITIDYTFPQGWPAQDIDIDSLRISATDCNGPLGDRSFGVAAASASAILTPSYDAIIGKAPTTAIQLSFPDDAVKSDCLFRVKIASLSTRCNTSVTFDDSAASLAPGIEFRINCDTVQDACNNETSPPFQQPMPPAPIPISSKVAVDPMAIVSPIAVNTPGQVPPGIQKPDDTNASSNIQVMPSPPPLPFFVDQNQAPTFPQAPSISVLDVSPNGSDVAISRLMPPIVFPPFCELEMLDVEPTLSPISSSVLDLKTQWLERQPLPPLPTPLYFAIRYGPVVRKLVDDDRFPNEIIPGYETIVRTGQQQPGAMDPTREITIPSIQRGSLLKLQICAIYDPNTEPTIQWSTVRSRRIDLAALEPFLELENPSPAPLPPNMASVIDMHNSAAAFAADLSPISPIMNPIEPPSQPDMTTQDNIDSNVPLLIAVNVEPTSSSTTYWLTIAAGALLILLTTMMILLFLRRMCISRRQCKKIQPSDKAMYYVSTIPPPKPTIKEEVKVPLS